MNLIERAIREAYAAESAYRQQQLGYQDHVWVMIVSIREDIAGRWSRAEIDETLRSMARGDDVVIAPENNQKILTPAQRYGAVIIGQQEKHMMMIY